MERTLAVLVELVQHPQVVLASLVERGVALGHRHAYRAQTIVAVLEGRAVHLCLPVQIDVILFLGVLDTQDTLALRAPALRELLERRHRRIDFPSLEPEARVGHGCVVGIGRPGIELTRRDLTIRISLPVEDRFVRSRNADFAVEDLHLRRLGEHSVLRSKSIAARTQRIDHVRVIVVGVVALKPRLGRDDRKLLPHLGRKAVDIIIVQLALELRTERVVAGDDRRTTPAHRHEKHTDQKRTHHSSISRVDIPEFKKTTRK